jgi:HAD superfamily hydrolase (TIGR01549 family)
LVKRNIIFDLDGTLVDSRDSIIASVTYALAKIGRTEKIDPVRVVRQDLFSTLRETAEKYGTRFKDEERFRFIRAYRQHQKETVATLVKSYDGVHDALAEMKKHFTLAVATTKTTEQAVYVLETFKLDRFFDHIQGTDRGIRHKPQPDVLLRTQTCLGAHSRSVYVGDSPNDVLAAKNAHMFSVGVLYGFSELTDLEPCEPDWVMESFEDILALKEELLGPTVGQAIWPDKSFDTRTSHIDVPLSPRTFEQ